MIPAEPSAPPSGAEHDAAIGAAWMAGGVFEVRDDLAITG
jgi:hypothetical protein